MQAWLMKEVSGVGQTFALGLWLATLEFGLHKGGNDSEMCVPGGTLLQPALHVLNVS